MRPGLVEPDQEWRAQAACRGLSSSVDDPWHPEAGEMADSFKTARRICRGCPVRRDCLAWVMGLERGLSSFSRYGMWGGFSARQRARLDPTVTAARDQPEEERCEIAS